MSIIKVDTIRPVTSGADLSLQGDSGGSAVDCLNIDSSGNIDFTGNTDAKIKLPSAGGIYESDGSTAILTESGGAVTLANVLLGAGVSLPSGSIVNVQSVTYQGKDTNDTGNWVIVGSGDSGELTITTATPKSSSSKFYISATIGAVCGSNTTAFRIYRGSSSPSGLDGTPADTRIGVIMRAGKNWNADTNHTWGVSFSAVDSPGSGSASVYTVRFLNQVGQTTTIGASEDDTDTAESYGSRASCQMIVMEIAG